MWGFLFGILIEWRGLRQILRRNIKVNWLIAPAILLMIISIIPRIYWAVWFGAGTAWFINIFRIAEFQLLLNAFSGILLIRSLVKSN